MFVQWLSGVMVLRKLFRVFTSNSVPTLESDRSVPRDLRSHSILEPIHGLVRLSDIEIAVLDHRLFRRLRKIKQNGLLYLVFPSATHNRFEHSIGALHVVDSMVEQTWLNSVVGRRKKTIVPFSDGRENLAVDFSAASPDELRWVIRVARMSALVHDLGHGPLSHTFDSFAPLRRDLRTLLTSGAIPILKDVAAELAGWDQGGAEGSTKFERVPHEVMSCVLFAHLWPTALKARNLDHYLDQAEHATLPLAVTAAVLGKPSFAKDSPHGKAWLPFIHDLIASAPADADRMDYLERDSRSIGVTYGLFDRNRVLKSLVCYREGSGKEARYRLGVKRSGLMSLENRSGPGFLNT
jgi:HD superfamily phosphohydrolase